MQPVTIMIADDHDVVRQGLKMILSREERFSVIGEADNGGDIIRLVEEKKPDVLVVDNLMPGISGIEVIETLTDQGAKTKMIILTMASEPAYLRRAFAVGASAYVLKDSTTEELVMAVNTVLLGKKFLSQKLNDRDINAAFSSLWGKATADKDPLKSLTERENQILRLILRDKSNLDIADILKISVRTVETHRKNIMQKLGLTKAQQLHRWAVQHKLVSIDETGNVIEVYGDFDPGV